MEQIILNILEALRRGETVDDKALVKLIHAEARREGADKRDLAKRRLLPFYQRVKREEPARWAGWNVDAELERRLLQVLRMKPRRTASGVATITVITKPWPCSGDCLFCPNDLRMPKSYLHAEPACARAEQNCFDPYLQVSARLTALSQMGHATDKIELIVLGGTWSDYPEGYQTWFMSELFRALNDDAVAGVAANPMLARPGISRAEAGRLLDDAPADALPPVVAERRERYRAAGIATDEAELAAGVADEQGRVDASVGGYNRAVRRLYGPGTPWGEVAEWQAATMEELERQQRINETAKHRVVGLVIETRPDAVTPQAITLIRRLGCTKIQMGIQSLDQHLLDINERRISVAQIERAFSLARLFGFKIHAHFMLNLLGATPEGDKRDYERFMTEGAFMPDEVKVYPCALIEGSRLVGCYERGEWRPYAEEELLDVLAAEIDSVVAVSPLGDAVASNASRSPSCGKPVVRMSGVVAGYRGAPAVLNGLDFCLLPGSVVGIVGHNGAGKTTFARCMAGLLKEKAGVIEVDDVPLRARKRAGRVYLVMQEPGYQLFSSTVDDELASACSSDGAEDSLGNKDRIAAIKAALALEGLADRHPLSLSGGERQRLSIAAGLLSSARAMILDEPTSGLDYRNMRRIDAQIARMRDAGIAVCVVSHDYEFLCSACDEIALVEDGRIAERFPLNKATLPKLKLNVGFAEIQ